MLVHEVVAERHKDLASEKVIAMVNELRAIARNKVLSERRAFKARFAEKIERLCHESRKIVDMLDVDADEVEFKAQVKLIIDLHEQLQNARRHT